jgi:hypothetical protein
METPGGDHGGHGDASTLSLAICGDGSCLSVLICG